MGDILGLDLQLVSITPAHISLARISRVTTTTAEEAVKCGPADVQEEGTSRVCAQTAACAMSVQGKRG